MGAVGRKPPVCLLYTSMAIAADPSLIIADEPTTALDVTIQAQILQLLRSLRERRGVSIILISHDLAVICENCDYVYVMYCGQIVAVSYTHLERLQMEEFC